MTLWCALPLAAQISPGPLSSAHQSLNGVTECTTCHEISTGKPTLKCLSCHGEIASRVCARKGLHAAYNSAIDASSKCATCHSEHNGEDFNLIKWDIKTFDHRQTGYALDGKHAGISCNRCHNSTHVAAGERPSIKIKDLNRTFLGASPSCTTCHEDQHKGRLGSDCLQCHNFESWKAIRVGTFDHSRTRYPLTGLHVQVGCKSCHTSGSDGQPRYRGIAFGSCADCHSDPHRGEFKQSCESCHGTAGWKRVSGSALDDDFDHSKTKFPLLGKHAAVDCMECHTGGDFKKPLAFKKCSDCHQPDPHGGQFAKRLDGGECSSCHTVDGFKPAEFGLKQHAATAYPLEGKHASLQCAQCHVPKGKDTQYKIKFQQCTDCHSDEHAGQFAAAPYFNACQDCHNLQRLTPSTFGLSRHKSTRFPLTGGHVAVACNDCHRVAEFKPKPTPLYHWPKLACTACHEDPHKGQFNALMRQVGSNGKASGCESCHSTQSWKEFSRFDHTKTAFPLLGVHQTTACRDCHNPPNSKVLLVNANFKAAPTKCESCHASIHGAQFVKGGVTPCAECHDSAKWKPSLFDHDKRTSFSLQGAHRNVACDGCHKLIRTIGGKTILFYKPTPTSCAACHGSDAVKKSATVQ